MYNHSNQNKYNSNKHNITNFNKNITIIGSWDSDDKKSFSKYRNSYSFEDRMNETNRIMNKYPDRIPVICEKSFGKNNPNIDKNKYLVSSDLTISNFIFAIRKRIKLEPHDALFLMINDIIPPTTANFKELYYRHKDIDGYLYITYTKENVFG
jgi:GABA(A) receptor-associated protein